MLSGNQQVKLDQMQNLGRFVRKTSEYVVVHRAGEPDDMAEALVYHMTEERIKFEKIVIDQRSTPWSPNDEYIRNCAESDRMHYVL